MSVRSVHQFVPSLAARDAIGAHTLHVQDLLREMGLASEIFVGDVHDELASRARPYRSFARHRGTGEAWILYQSSIGSPVADYFGGRDEPKLLNYHNITPASLLEGWEPRVAEETSVGRRQLARMAGHVRFSIADSFFNEKELRECGYKATTVVPPLVDVSSFDDELDRQKLEELRRDKTERGGADLLFVGRVLPHKAHHDLIKVLAVYRHLYDPEARLHLVGGVGSPTYQRALEAFVAGLGLGEAVDLAGSVTRHQLASYYRCADAFVCCSNHEGFCLPLLEAMHHRLPIVAYGVAAVPETTGGAGLVLPNKDPLEMAAAVHRAVSDLQLREALAGACRQRLLELDISRSRVRFARAIEEVLGNGK